MSKFLDDLQKRQDNLGYTIAFLDENPRSINEALRLALKMERTKRVYKDEIKKGKDQQLGSSRSFHDLYLIIKHYFPKATIYNVSDFLRSLYFEDRLANWLCHEFGKQMFAIATYSGSIENEKNLKKYIDI